MFRVRDQVETSTHEEKRSILKSPRPPICVCLRYFLEELTERCVEVRIGKGRGVYIPAAEAGAWSPDAKPKVFQWLQGGPCSGFPDLL
jgi:hypothetical protein